MDENKVRDELAAERRMNLVELREDIADLRDIIMELNKVVAAQSAEINAMAREIGELRNFRNGVIGAAATVLVGALGFLIEKTLFK